MAATSTLELRPEKAARRTLSELVMAWAHDVASGEPRYILELDAGRRGAKCGCICVGCGEPLIAVNAAKKEFIKRPHFRHIEGVEHSDCVVLAARAAALRQLEETGWLELPRRRISRQVAGLSGTFYDAWVERLPEKLRITDVHYCDRAAAVFTFEDGRTLRVDLTGAPSGEPADADFTNELHASILITVDDPEIAALDPAEVRKRLTLLPDALCWRSHWADAELSREAECKAREQASLYLDQVPDDLVLPPDMDPALKRESILHHEVKRILAEECRVAVPEFALEVSAAVGAETLAASWMLEADVLKLDHIELEQPHGDIIPDLACKAYPKDGGRVFVPMFIEITVSNPVDDTRLARIRAKKNLALEIDLSRAGGRVTREELRRLVVDELATKRWLYHPEVEEQREALLQQLQARANRRAQVLAIPLADIAREYLDTMATSLREDKDREAQGETVGLRLGTPTDEKLADAIDKLAIHGFPEAGASIFIASHGILDRILSIQYDVGFGYRLSSGHAVLNAIKQDRAEDRAYHSLYLIATLTFKPKFTDEQRKKFDSWRADVRESIKAGELTYLRPTTFDRILALLFPQMAEALAKEGAKRDGGKHSRARSTQWHETHDRHPAMLVSTQPRSDKASWPLLDTRPADWWLRGRDLERWKRQNPKWASYWTAQSMAGAVAETQPDPAVPSDNPSARPRD